MQVLLVLNGAPGVGKSALAGRYANEHRLTLVVDVDDLRRNIGQWKRVQESKGMARDLAVALARAHLSGGFDVVVAQYLGRPDFARRLTAVASEAGASSFEVVLTDEDEHIVERFRRRRAKFRSIGIDHPEAELGDDAFEAEIRSANARLRAHATANGLAVIDIGAGLEAAYRALCEAIASTASLTRSTRSRRA